MIAPVVATPLQIQRAQGTWRIMRPPPGDDGIYISIVAGPDGAMWLTDFRGRLVRLDARGKRSSYPLRFSASGTSHTFLPAYATLGADAKFYLTGCVDVTTNCGFIGVSEGRGRIAAVPIPSGDSARFSGVALGPDGNVWFADSANVGKIAPSGRVEEFPYPSGEATNELSGVAAGPDGKMWFVEADKNLVGNVDPQSGKIVEFAGIGCGLSGMDAGPDGNLYAACGPSFLQITPSGKMVDYGTYYPLSDGAQEIENAPGGALCVQFLSQVGRFDPAKHLLVTYAPPDGTVVLYGSATAPDEKQWILAEDGTVYVLTSPGSLASR